MNDGPSCNHLIGEGVVEYQTHLFHAEDEFRSASEHSFTGFQFCPYCGEDISRISHAFDLQQRAHWEEFWKEYGELHGPEELQRARRR